MGRTPGVDARFHRRRVADAVDGGVDVEYVLRPPRRLLRFSRRFLARHYAMEKSSFLERFSIDNLLEESKGRRVNGGPADRQTDHPLIEMTDTDKLTFTPRDIRRT